MPPRTRKTAAAKPADDAAVLPEASADEAATTAEPDVEAAPEQVEQPAEDSVDPEPAAPEVEPEAAAPVPVAALSHWELVGMPGIADAPCRMCLPGGPPAGSGSVGCQHGQWVQVWDGDA